MLANSKNLIKKALRQALAFLIDVLLSIFLLLWSLPLVNRIINTETYRDCFSSQMPYLAMMVIVFICVFIFEFIFSGSPGKRIVGLKFFYANSEHLSWIECLRQIFMFYATLGNKGAELRRVSSKLDAWIALPLLIFLCLLTLPNLRLDEERDRNSSVKANMRTFQTILETYSAENRGAYPVTLTTLEQAGRAIGHEYWKDFTNPFTGLSGTGSLKMEQEAHEPGFVTYAPVIRGGKVFQYFIYGYKKSGERVKDQCHEFVLSNS